MSHGTLQLCKCPLPDGIADILVLAFMRQGCNKFNANAKVFQHLSVENLDDLKDTQVCESKAAFMASMTEQSRRHTCQREGGRGSKEHTIGSQA